MSVLIVSMEEKMVQSYKDLIVWQRAMDVVIEVYKLVKLLPKEETYALSDQMRRSAVSIPSNIAEGQGRNSTKEYLQFLSIAKGSICELETQLIICNKTNYLTAEQTAAVEEMLQETGKMLNALMKKLRQVKN